jgi:tetratricopeptide (TPR) repeat protein
MRVAVLIALLSAATAAAAAGQQKPDRVAEAYSQFLLGHHLDEIDDETGAIAAYKKAMELDPTAAEIPGELSALYLRENKIQEAMATAEQAVKLSPSNREGNRVLGVINAALSESSKGGDNAAKAIKYLETSIAGQGTESDPNVRATLARLYIGAQQYDKAISMLTVLVDEQPGWQDGPLLLAQAYSAAGRSADAIAWLKDRAEDDSRLLPTLGEFYERERRWKDAADAYGKAVEQAPRNTEFRARYASALVNAGGRENLTKARDLLTALTSSRPGEQARIFYLLSQTQRRLGEFKAAEDTARRVIEQNSKSPWGYYALAEALEGRRDYQGVVTELAPVVAQYSAKAADPAFDVGLLLPHLGFAYQELGQHEKAVATFEDARRLAPTDPAVASYLADANIAAKNYGAAIDAAKAGLADNPGDLRLLRLQALALRHTGKAEQGAALLEESVRAHGDDPMAYLALAQFYGDIDRGPQAIRVLQDAQAKFPADDTIGFELGATFDRQKRFADAEATFKSLIARDPQNAPALNYLGYMLAERGERLEESVDYVKKALAIEPDNGSYLDSLGWAYYKADKLELAEDNLKKAADQLTTNSVVQDHYGDVLLKMGRYEDANAAFNRALTGDGDSIDRADIDKKIRSARRAEEVTLATGTRLVPSHGVRGGLLRRFVLRSFPHEAAVRRRRAGVRRGPSRRRGDDDVSRRQHVQRRSRGQRIGRRPESARAAARRPRRSRLGADRSAGAVRSAGVHLRRARRRRDAAAAARRPRPRAWQARSGPRSDCRRAARRGRAPRRHDRMRRGSLGPGGPFDWRRLARRAGGSG